MISVRIFFGWVIFKVIFESFGVILCFSSGNLTTYRLFWNVYGPCEEIAYPFLEVGISCLHLKIMMPHLVGDPLLYSWYLILINSDIVLLNWLPLTVMDVDHYYQVKKYNSLLFLTYHHPFSLVSYYPLAPSSPSSPFAPSSQYSGLHYFPDSHSQNTTR